MRSNLKALVASALLVSGICAAQEPPDRQSQFRRPLEPQLRFTDPSDMESAYLDPYIEIEPLGMPPVDGLERSVIYFFSPNCAGSQKLHDNIMHWGSTLPDGWRFMPLAVAGPGHTAPALVGFAGRIEAMNGGEFAEDRYWHLLYDAALTSGWSLEDVDGAVEMAVQAGANEQQLRRILYDTPRPAEATMDTARLVQRYELDRTPMLVVADQWITHPDLVGNNPLNLMQVGNALVSLAMSDVDDPHAHRENGDGK